MGIFNPYIGQMNLLRTIACLLVFLVAPAASADDFVLGLPLDCKIGLDCWIQQYAAHRPLTNVAPVDRFSDYACGLETYDKHDGTDFRVRDTGAHVAVLATALGTVKAVRDGVPDHLVKSEADRAQVKKIECGNGVVIDHAGGWQTQYCHMRKGSVLVKAGDVVATGAKLGEVGFSGEAAFPHVHLTVRHSGKTVDPFGGDPIDGPQKCDPQGQSIWNKEAQASLTYHSYGDIIGTGFHYEPIQMAQLETGDVTPENPSSSWPALVAYVWAINLSAGDKITVTLRGPNGVMAENSVTLDRHKAQYMLFAGKKRPAGGWVTGTYGGSFVVTRDGVEHLKREWQAEVK
jgi:hypothetical protein